MAIATTYTPIETYTVTNSSTPSITFSSLGSYTDLVIVGNFGWQTSDDYLSIQFNNDTTASNYSMTNVRGNSNAVGTNRYSSSNGFVNLTAISGGDNTLNTSVRIDLFDYRNSSTYNKVFVTRHDDAQRGTSMAVGQWTNTNAITSITLKEWGGNNFYNGSSFTIYGILATDNASANKATGGTITVGSGYTYHKFTSGGTFTPSQNITADILLIAGGGGGGTYSGGGGGGGAGGVLLLSNQELTSGTGYTVSVGGGGAANTSGQNSYFGALTQAVGGGYGGSASIGGNGGSGGGASDTGYAAGTGTAGQGFNGGTGTGAGSSPGGGGGGALQAGQNAYGDSTPNIAGYGGSGTNFYYDWAGATSTGVSGYYAGGGGGGVYINSAFANNGGGAGGNGGGGSGGSSNKNATTNSGSGGGGGSYTSSPVAPGNGGSGLVIVRYAN